MPPWYPLIGEHELTIDEKGRLLVPSDVRKRLETFGENDTLILMNMGGRGFMYPEKFHLSRFGNVRTGIVPTVQEQQLLRALFGPSIRLVWDKQGRILLSPKTIAGFKLDREITLVCAGDHVELWNRQDWAAEQARLMEQMPDLIAGLSTRLERTEPLQ
ncbi:MAG: division/cell wall cluster transcriptional repressor MraZ [Tepidisphaeraceae bacterium]